MRAVILTTLLIPFLLFGSARAQSGAGDTADAEYLDVTHEYILHPDGSTTYNYEHHLKLRSYFSFNRAYGESFVLYNPAWQSLKIRKSETVMADGKKVSAPFNAYNELLPGFCSGAAPYAHLREMVVTHTGLERDAVVHFAYTIETKAGMLPGLTGKVVCGERSPIRRMTVIVRTPGNVTLMYALHSPDPRPGAPAPLSDPVATVESEGASSTARRNVYTWRISDLPLTAVETAQPALEQCVPVLFFTTATRMQAVQHVLGGEAGLYTLAPQAESRVAALAGGGKSELEMVLALRSYVENSVGSMSGNLQLLGYHPLRAQETYDRNVGSALDRAVLLAAMLKSAGFEAAPLLSSDFISFFRYTAPMPGKPGGTPVRNAEDLACLPAFAKAAVVCRLKSGQGLLLDPNAPQPGPFPSRYAGRPYMVLGTNSFSIDRLAASPADNVIRSINEWSVKPDRTIEGKSTLDAGGIFGAPYQKEQFAGAAKRRIQSGAQGLTAASDSLQTSSEDVTVAAFRITSEKPLERSDGLIALALPGAPGGFADMHLAMGRVPRTTPLELPGPFREENLTTIHLPRDLTPAFLPPAWKISNAAGEVESRFDLSGSDLRIVRRISITASRITPELFEQFQALAGAWSDPMHQKILLETR